MGNQHHKPKTLQKLHAIGMSGLMYDCVVRIFKTGLNPLFCKRGWIMNEDFESSRQDSNPRFVKVV
jgi:hypothetical protein